MAVAPRSDTLTAVYEPVEDGWTQARFEELPEVITAGPSLEEAKSLLADALNEYLLSLAQDGHGFPAVQHALRERVVIQLSPADGVQDSL